MRSRANNLKELNTDIISRVRAEHKAESKIKEQIVLTHRIDRDARKVQELSAQNNQQIPQVKEILARMAPNTRLDWL
jgi:predicted small metal-binding protein